MTPRTLKCLDLLTEMIKLIVLEGELYQSDVDILKLIVEKLEPKEGEAAE
jgi:hypothetical protein